MAGSAVELAVAYVSLVPSTNQIAPAIRKEVAKADADVASSGKKAGAGYAAGLGGAIGGAAKGIFAPLAAAAATVGVGQFFRDALTEASALQQSVGGVEAVFKGQAAAIKAASAEASQNLGLSKNAYNEMATVLGAMLKNQGLRDFTGQTQRLIGVGADLAAQFGGSTREAVEALAAAMRGESDPIERYGISLNETAVKAELAAMGSDKLKGAALEQAKAQARINIIMRQSADAQGAFAREADTAAGKQQRLAASWENFKSAIGGALLPVLSRVLDVLAAVGVGVTQLWGAMSGGDSVLSRVQAAFAALVQSPVGQWFTALVKDIAGVLSPALAEVAQLVTGTVWPAMQALGQVWVTVAKGYLTFAGAILGSPVGQFLTTLLKGAIVGFFVGVKDVFVGLVKIVSGAWDAIAGLLTGDWARMWSGLGQVVVGAVQALWGFLQAGLMGRVLSVFRGFATAATMALSGLGSFTSGLLRGMAAGFVEFGGTLGRIAGAVIGPAVRAVGAAFGLLKGLADKAVSSVVAAFTGLGAKITSALKMSDDAMRAFGTSVRGVWDGLVSAVTGAWTAIFGRVFTPMRQLLAGTILAAWTGFGASVSATWAAVTSVTSAAWARLAAVFTTLRTWLTATLTAAVTLFRTVTAAQWAAITAAITTAWARVLAVFTTLRTWATATLPAAMTAFRTNVTTVWSAVLSAISTAWTNILSRVFTPLRTWVTATLTAAMTLFRTATTTAWNGVFSAISGAWSRITPIFTTVRTWLTSTLTAAMTTLRTATTTAWNGVVTVISTAWSRISTSFTNLKNGVNQVWSFFQTAVRGIGQTWSGLTSAIQVPVNSARTWINSNLVSRMNSALSTVGVSLRVPQLASGGVWLGPGETRAASGTVLPGYTPGRDPHRFYSPTGGALALSGGEAVMVPEWTRAVGPRLVAMMNRIARRGGVEAIRKFLWGSSVGKPSTAFAQGGIYRRRREYADGGVLDALKGAAGSALSGAAARLEGLASSAADVFADPVAAITKLGSSVLGSLPGRGKFPAELLYGAMGKLVSGVAAKVKDSIGALLGGGGFSRSGSWPPRVMGRVSPNTAAAVAFVRSAFGIGNIGTLGQRKNASDHPWGKALDAMIPNWGGASGISLGNRVASWFVANPGRFGTKYVIWREKINSGGGWKHYTHPSGLTDANSLHYNHVHVSFLKSGGLLGGGAARGRAGGGSGGVIRPKLFDGGGMLRRGDVAVHDAVKPDRVLTDAQWRAVMRHLPVPDVTGRPGAGRGGVTIQGDVYGDPRRFAREITTRMRDELVLADLAGV